MDVTTLYIQVDSKGVVQTTSNLKDFNKTAKTTATQTDKTTASTERFNSANKKTKATLAEASSGLKTVGRDINRYSLLMAGAATAVTKFSFDLSKGLGQVQTLIPDTGDRIYELEQAVKDLAVESGVSFDNLTDGLYQTISAFQDTADTVEIFEQATKASIAGASSVADSIELASAVTKAYGDTTAEATQKVFDLAFETVRLGQTTFPQLANGIQTATDSAVRLGVSQEELFATFSALTGVIGDTSEVATKFRSASASLLNPNAKLLDLFERLEKATGEQVTTGDDFVEVTGGWANALKLITDTAADSDEPFQDYIRRIEGITLASRISGNSLEKYQSDLEAMADVVGVSDKAFEEATEGIDKFRRDILKSVRQMEVAATEIGDNLVPRLAELVQNIADAVTWFSSWNAETQQLIITLAGLLAVSGPVLIFFGSVARAIKGLIALKAVPFIAGLVTALGPVGLIAVLGGAVAALLLFNKGITENIEKVKQQRAVQAEIQGDLHSFQRSLNEAAIAQLNLNEEGDLSAEVIERLTDMYPDLVAEVGEYSVALAEAKVSLINLRREETAQSGADLFAIEIERINELQESVEKYAKLYSDAEDRVLASGSFLSQEEQLKKIQETQDFAIAKYEEFRDRQLAIINEINTQAIPEFGIEADLTDSGLVEFDAIFQSLRDYMKDTGLLFEEGLELPEADPDGSRLKTWEEWFEDVTDVAISRFNTIEKLFDEEGKIIAENIAGNGKLAGEAFISDLEDSLSRELALGDLLGEDALGLQIDGFSGLADASRDAILELEAIREEQIADGEVFTNTDRAIRTQIDAINRWKATLEELMEIQFREDVYKDLNAVDALTKVFGESEGSFESLTDKADILRDAIKKALEEGFDASTFLTQLDETEGEIANTFEGASQAALDFNAVFEEDLFDMFQKLFALGPQVSLVFADIASSLADIGIDALTSSFFELGRVLADSTKSAEDFKKALADQLQAILNMLPSLFIQAGLQLIVNNQTALGLGFIFGGLTTAIIGGLTQGAIDDATANAHGNAFNASGISKFATGGSFVNSVVDTPTYFRYGGSNLGMMGEAGPEAILPLTRTSSGNLGVETSGMGGGASVNVSVKVINNTNAEVTTNETQTPDGREIEVIVGQVVNSGISSGRYDKAMKSRYGTQVQGVTY